MKISICIPTYNRADLLRATLESVARQTVQPDEVLIIDNASTDNTASVAKKYRSRGFRYIRNEKNIGMAGNYNRCIELARNELFTFLPSDDLIAPTWYEEWIRIVNHYKADLYTSPVSIMDETYKILFAFPVFKTSRYIRQPHVLKSFTTNYMPMPVPSAATIFRKSTMKKIGGFDPREGTECDVRPCTKLLDMGDVYYYHRFLFVFREHKNRSYDTEKAARDLLFFERFTNYLRILQDIYKNRYQNKPSYRFFLQCNLFMNLCNINLYAARGEWRKIIHSYQLVFSYFPDILHTWGDYPVFFRYQGEFIKRALTMGRIKKNIQKEFEWLQLFSLSFILSVWYYRQIYEGTNFLRSW